MFLLCFIFASLGGCGSVSRAPDRGESGARPPHSAPISAAVGREAVLQAISMLGVRYAPGGTSPASGFDCSGLVGYAYFRVLDRELPRTTQDLSRAGLRIDSRDLRPGDLVFFNTQGHSYSHVGIYVGGNRFIHAPSSGGVVRIDDMRGGYWLRRFDGARRVAL
jgi:cell wall-associated NlpC family hydrolase